MHVRTTVAYGWDARLHAGAAAGYASDMSPLEMLEASAPVESEDTVQRAWADEAQARLEAYDRGDIRALTLEETMNVIDKAIAGARAASSP